MLRDAVSDAVSDLSVPKAPVLPLFAEQASAWLGAPTSLAHWWSPDASVLDEAVRALQAQAEALTPARVTRVFQEGDFLALLQRLNGLLAAAQREEPQAQAHAGQLWVLDRAERVSAEHLDILRRICLHYPELRIHLALFSQAPQAPAAAEGVQVHALVPSGGVPMIDSEVGANPPPGAQGKRWLWGAVVCVAVAGSAWLLLRTGQGAVSEPGRQMPAAPAQQVGSAPVASEPMPELQTSSLPLPQASSAPQSEARVPAKDGALSASRRWLLGLPSGSLVVVHAQTDTLREAEAFKADKSVLANARILLTSAEGQPPRFLVATGPFRSPDRAQNYMQRLDWKSAARSVGREELLVQVPH